MADAYIAGVGVYTTTTGTGAYTITGTIPGYAAITRLPDGARATYRVTDFARTEVVIGTYDSTAGTLSREEVLHPTSGGPVNWPAGRKLIFLDVPDAPLGFTGRVNSVAGRIGDVTLSTDDISGLATVATSGSAADLTTGTLPDARLSSTGVSAGTYTNATVTVDIRGRITAASSGTGGSGGASSVDGLDDVIIDSGLADNDFLIFGGDEYWRNRTPAYATLLLSAFTGDSGSGGIKGLVPAPAAGDAAANKVLGAGGGWVAQAGGGSIGGSSDAVLDSALADGDLLTYVGGFWTNQPPKLDEPGGRLTLTSGTPVLTADTTGSTVYYTEYKHRFVPLDGVMRPLPGGELSITLDTATALSGNVYDMFLFIHNGIVRGGYAGQAWSSTTSRGTGVGTIELTRNDHGFWVNKYELTNVYNGATNFGPISIGRALYVGSFYATSNGQTKMEFSPTEAAGGTNNFLALYNAYNRVTISALCRDSTASWTYASGTWRSANNSTSNRITYLDGLGQSAARMFYTVLTSIATGSNCGVAVLFDATSGTPTLAAQLGGNTIALTAFNQLISLGLHYGQAMEARTFGGSTASFFGTNSSVLNAAVNLQIEL